MSLFASVDLWSAGSLGGRILGCWSSWLSNGKEAHSLKMGLFHLFKSKLTASDSGVGARLQDLAFANNRTSKARPSGSQLGVDQVKPRTIFSQRLCCLQFGKLKN